MLYTTVARKPLSNFDLLLYVLQDTDNEKLAKVLEKSLKSGDKSIARVSYFVSAENDPTIIHALIKIHQFFLAPFEFLNVKEKETHLEQDDSFELYASMESGSILSMFFISSLFK